MLHLRSVALALAKNITAAGQIQQATTNKRYTDCMGSTTKLIVLSRNSVSTWSTA